MAGSAALGACCALSTEEPKPTIPETQVAGAASGSAPGSAPAPAAPPDARGASVDRPPTQLPDSVVDPKLGHRRDSTRSSLRGIDALNGTDRTAMSAPAVTAPVVVPDVDRRQ